MDVVGAMTGHADLLQVVRANRQRLTGSLPLNKRNCERDTQHHDEDKQNDIDSLSGHVAGTVKAVP